MSLPPPDSPDAPKYWRQETSGRLEGPIMRYLEGKLMSTEDITLIRLYLRQWIDSPAWLMNPEMDSGARRALTELRQRVRLIFTRQDPRRLAPRGEGSRDRPAMIAHQNRDYLCGHALLQPGERHGESRL
jgi:hypothetical protein